MTSTSPSPSGFKKQASVSNTVNTVFIWLTGISAIGVAVILLFIGFQVAMEAGPAIAKFGLGFLVQTTWNPVEDVYGAWPHVYGTVMTSFIALLIALPIGLGVALLLSEDFLPVQLQTVLTFLVELLAAIPSVVYGLWGLFVLIPMARPLGLWLHKNFEWVPLFSTSPAGPGVYVAGLVLSIMILPIIAAISRDSLASVPRNLREASVGLGATRWETIFKVIIPAASSGIIGGTMLALGRALGETMAVTMVIGNKNAIPKSIFDGASTVSSLLANQFAEASGLQIAALMYAALVLFGLTLIVNVLAELIVRRIRQI